MNEIGIMQGRLSPPVTGRLQAFPWSAWEQEFHRARACGFDTIEWLFEAEGAEQNPIWAETGLERIRRQMEITGIRLHSLCADYFMAYPLFRVSEQERAHNASVLNKLILQAARVGIRTILLPVLEVTNIRTDAEKDQLIESLCEPLSLALEQGIRLGLETELSAGEYRGLVEQCNHPALGVYYDTGNAASKGYDVAADIRALHAFLLGVHIKDRKRGGPSVSLGQGDVNFDAFFRALAEVGYTGPVTLQTAFSEDYLGIARAHLKFVQGHLSQHPSGVDSAKELPG